MESIKLSMNPTYGHFGTTDHSHAMHAISLDLEIRTRMHRQYGHTHLARVLVITPPGGHKPHTSARNTPQASIAAEIVQRLEGDRANGPSPRVQQHTSGQRTRVDHGSAPITRTSAPQTTGVTLETVACMPPLVVGMPVRTLRT